MLVNLYQEQNSIHERYLCSSPTLSAIRFVPNNFVSAELAPEIVLTHKLIQSTSNSIRQTKQPTTATKATPRIVDFKCLKAIKGKKHFRSSDFCFKAIKKRKME